LFKRSLSCAHVSPINTAINNRTQELTTKQGGTILLSKIYLRNNTTTNLQGTTEEDNHRILHMDAN
jgi:hypothetical protein